MHPNPNKFLMVLFSFIPGAGHMYLGLMRRGLSFMIAFAGSIAGAGLFSVFNLAEYVLIALIPLIWFVAFFDFWRFPRLTPEERAAVKDAFLIPEKVRIPGSVNMRMLRIGGGVLLILAGLLQIYRGFFLNHVYSFFRSDNVINFFYDLPTLVGAVTIIVVGLLLIFWKGRQLKKEARRDEEQ